MSKIIILGAGGLARELYWNCIDADNFSEFCFVDELTQETHLEISDVKFLIIKDWHFPVGFTDFLMGVGDPKVKKDFAKKALHRGLKPAPTLINPRAMVHQANIGRGGSISAASHITANVKIGDYVLINGVGSIGHDCIIGDYTTINPGVCISGNVEIGEGCVIGSGTIIKEKIKLPPGTITGIQAAVVKSPKE